MEKVQVVFFFSFGKSLGLTMILFKSFYDGIAGLNHATTLISSEML